MGEFSPAGNRKYVIGIIVAIVLALTNPAEEKHKQTVLDRLSQQAASEGVWATLAFAATKDLILLPVQYHNYLLFSTTTYDDQRLTIGVLGNVFITSD